MYGLTGKRTVIGNTSTHNLRNATDIGMVHANSQLSIILFFLLLFASGMNYLRILDSQVI